MPLPPRHPAGSFDGHADVRLPVRELVFLSLVRRVLAEGPEAPAPAADDHDDDQAVRRPARREVPAGGDAVGEKPQTGQKRERTYMLYGVHTYRREQTYLRDMHPYYMVCVHMIVGQDGTLCTFWIFGHTYRIFRQHAWHAFERLRCGSCVRFAFSVVLEFAWKIISFFQRA